MKAAWELMVIFYADHKSQAWTPEQLVDWLAVRTSFKKLFVVSKKSLFDFQSILFFVFPFLLRRAKLVVSCVAGL